jgi:hypothetical protein
LEASADVVVTDDAQSSPLALSKKGKDGAEVSDEGKAINVETLPERELDAIPDTTSKAPGINWKKNAGLAVGGLVGAGALAGVIAISLQKQPPTPAPEVVTTSGSAVVESQPVLVKVTDLSQGTAQGATVANVANQVGFNIGEEVMLGEGTPRQEVNTIKSFGSLVFQSPLKFPHPAGEKIKSVPLVQSTPPPVMLRGAAVDQDSSSTADGTTQMLIAGGGLAAVCLLLGCCALVFMMTSKKKKKPMMRGGRAIADPDERPPPPLVGESQYMPVGQESQYLPMPATGVGAVPTLDVVPMQTMPPLSTYAPRNQPTTSMYAASPLAATTNALPSSAMPTAYNMAAPQYSVYA